MNKLTPARVLDVMLLRTLLILALMAGSASAQDPPFYPPGAQDGTVPVSILFDRTHARPGEKIMMAVFFEIPEGLHIYPDYPQEFTNPTVITPAEHEWLTFGDPVWPKAYQATGGAFDGIFFHEGPVYAGIPVTVADDAPSGEIEVSVAIFYQGCTNSVCYNLQEPTVKATLRIDTEAFEPANPEVFAEIAGYTPQKPTAGDIAKAMREAPPGETDFSTGDRITNPLGRDGTVKEVLEEDGKVILKVLYDEGYGDMVIEVDPVVGKVRKIRRNE